MTESDTNKNTSCTNSLPECVRKHISHYLRQIDLSTARGVYDTALVLFDRALLLAVLEHCDNNKTRAAQVLGISRNTLRTKIKEIDVIK